MKKIAVIEDNEDNRLLVDAILEDQYETVNYVCGKEALQNLEQEQPDLILMDISLPEMDGPEVLKKLRQQETMQAVPVIALTAHAMKGDREKYLALGFNDYITKPIIDEDILLNAIKKLL